MTDGIAMTDGYLEGEEVSLYYTETGRGLPLLMIHGNGETHAIFDELAGCMSFRYRIIRMDSRGHGGSVMKEGHKTGELSISDMADDVMRLLEHLNLSGAILLGFSDGANVALEAASRYPHRVFAVISISGNALPWGMALPCYGAMIFQFAFWRFVECLPGKEARRGFAIRKRQLGGLMVRHPKLMAWDLRRIKAPVLILTGRRDLIRPRHSLWMGRQIADAKVVFVKGADHFTLLKREKAYARYILGYLRQKGL